MPQIKEKQFQLTEEEYNTISGLMEKAGSIFHRDREIFVKGVHSGKEAESQIFFNTFESFLSSVLTEKTPGWMPTLPSVQTITDSLSALWKNILQSISPKQTLQDSAI